MRYFTVLSRTRLKHILPLPQVFDALLYALTALLTPRRFAAMDAVERTVRTWPGIQAHTHRFGGTEFRRWGIEIGHLHGNGVLDLPLTPAVKHELITAGRVQNHHSFPDSSWVTFVLRSQKDVPAALSLLYTSYAHHAPPASAAVRRETPSLV